MSQTTSGPDHSMFAWSEYTQPHSTRQNAYLTNTKSNTRVSSQPIQHHDSIEASDHSNDPFSAYSTGSSFNYDHPTPLDSTDDAIHTPEIQDLYWQQNYHEVTGDGLDHRNTYNDSGTESMTATSFTEQLRSARDSLPSPESTNIATPETSGHSQKPSMNSTILTSPLSAPQQSKRPLASLDTDMTGVHDSNSLLYTSAPSSSRIASPAIHISKHSRGDSPARVEYDGPKFVRKKSVSNLSQGEYFPDVSTSGQASLLAPPSHDHMHVPEDDDVPERAGVDPQQRDDQDVPSIEDIEKQQQLERTVSEVQTWLQYTSLDPSAAERRRSRAQSKPDRIRSRSTGARPQTAQNPILMTQQAPGPGRMIDEQSEYHYSTGSEYSLESDDHPETHPAEIPPRKDSNVAPEDLEPLPKQFLRPRPWQDPFPAHVEDDGTRHQPETSKAAMYEFMKRARESETASRAATWGTGRRRLSDSDMDSILLGEHKTRHLSLSKRTRERGTTILRGVHNKAREQLLKRSNSHQKRQQQQLHEHPELEQVQSPEPIEERPSAESPKQVRQNSYPRPLSPSISAGLLGATNSLTAVGAGSTGMTLEADHHHSSFLRRTIKRVRSRSDVNRSPKSPSAPTSFMSTIGQQGGLPGPTVTSPSQEFSPPQQPTQQVPTQDSIAVAGELSPPESPIQMALSPQPAHILPTLDGFKIQIRELNPRLAPYLVERIAHDQLRRYKRLVKNKVDHIAAVAENRCPSGDLCFERGGEAEILPARAGVRDVASSSAHFKITPGADSDNEDSVFDGIVTPAAFPDGIPLPPTKKLPARFECPLCFQVKSFQKPSDWTKHVHEDVQPFTCTFPNCSEPKSFKRKADWVRHENERHRHLEWWSCNISECTHTCYRKDNFVQHLVREHKRKEPKLKGRGNANSKGKGKTSISGFNQEEQEFWNLVDTCRHEGSSDAKSEACKFCLNNCPSWKKLSVHVGKHMEQLAMPVLGLVKQRTVNKDTIISPVEPLPLRNMPYLVQETSVMSDMYGVVSPNAQSGTSNYQSSSAGHSPAVTNRSMGILPSQSFAPNYGMNGMPLNAVTMAGYNQGLLVANPGYTTYIGPDNMQYGSYNGQQNLYPQTQLSPDQYLPRSQGMDGSFVAMSETFEHSPHQAYYSSPEMEQTYMYPMNSMQMNEPMNMGSQQIHTPLTAQSMHGNGFIFPPQQRNRNQQYSPY